ncbi:MAG: RNA polymerase sigma factor [Patescibacteria group bacterium]|nr:RNA polymerase sigma factor [Patescibacteria group bacterium]
MESLNKNPTDEALAKLVQNGEIEKFGELVERYGKKLERYGRKFLQNSNSLEDLVQDVFLKAYKNIQNFNPDRKFSSWIYRIAHNEFINELKKNSRHPFAFIEPDLLALHPAVENTVSDLEKQEMRQLLESSLESLDQKYREVLILYYEEEFSYKEISDILTIPVATVGIRLQRGKLRLQEAYKRIETYGSNGSKKRQ